MATQQERLIEVLQGIERIEAVMGRDLPNLKRELRELLRLIESVPTATVPAGILCAGPEVWHTPPVGHVELVDSSQMIPAEQVELAARGGE